MKHGDTSYPFGGPACCTRIPWGGASINRGELRASMTNLGERLNDTEVARKQFSGNTIVITMLNSNSSDKIKKYMCNRQN